jgi:hypothetical protein
MSTDYWDPGVDTTMIRMVDTGYRDLPLPLGLSAGAKLTARRLLLLADGIHPITGGRLHPDAPTDASRTDRVTRPFTCGSCRFLTAHTYGQQGGVKGPKVELKCGFGGGDRITNGHATTLARWLPACPDHEAAPGVPPTT